MKVKNIWKYILVGIAGIALVKDNIRLRSRARKEREYGNRMNEYLTLYDQWIACDNKGYRLTDYFKKNEVSKIALYGYGILGARVYDILSGSDVSIDYVIDINANNMNFDALIISPDDDFPPVDMIVVTPFMEFEEICKMLSAKCDYPIISIEDIVL